MRRIVLLTLFLGLAQFARGADECDLSKSLSGTGASSCCSGLEVHVYPLKHISAGEAAASINHDLEWNNKTGDRTLDPLLSKIPRDSRLFIATAYKKPSVQGVVVNSDIIISADEKANSLIVISSPAYANQVAELIEKIDQPKTSQTITIETVEFVNGKEVARRTQTKTIEGGVASIETGRLSNIANCASECHANEIADQPKKFTGLGSHPLRMHFVTENGETGILQFAESGKWISLAATPYSLGAPARETTQNAHVLPAPAAALTENCTCSENACSSNQCAGTSGSKLAGDCVCNSQCTNNATAASKACTCCGDCQCTSCAGQPVAQTGYEGFYDNFAKSHAYRLENVSAKSTDPFASQNGGPRFQLQVSPRAAGDGYIVSWVEARPVGLQCACPGDGACASEAKKSTDCAASCAHADCECQSIQQTAATSAGCESGLAGCMGILGFNPKSAASCDESGDEVTPVVFLSGACADGACPSEANNACANCKCPSCLAAKAQQAACDASGCCEHDDSRIATLIFGVNAALQAIHGCASETCPESAVSSRDILQLWSCPSKDGSTNAVFLISSNPLAGSCLAAAGKCSCCANCDCSHCASQAAGQSASVHADCPSACAAACAAKGIACECALEAAKAQLESAVGLVGGELQVESLDAPLPLLSNACQACDHACACAAGIQQAGATGTCSHCIGECAATAACPDKAACTKLQFEKLVNEFNDLYEQKNYAAAEAKAKEAKALDPNSATAEVMFWKARFARRITTNEALSNKDSEISAVFDEVEQAVVARTRQMNALPPKVNRPQSEEEARISASLTKRLSLHHDKTPLNDVMRDIAAKAGINIMLDSGALEEVGITSSTPISIDVDGILLKSALNLILEPFRLSYTIDNEVLKITSVSRSHGNLIVVAYPVADLASGTGHCQDGAQMDLGGLAKTITQVINPASWQEGGGQGVIRPYPKTSSLVVRQNADAHKQIEALLTGMRALIKSHTEEPEKDEPLPGADANALNSQD